MGGTEVKVTVMVLKVDLQCEKCYKKVKKVLCKFSQIQDQMFNEKQNTVTITVVCCSPEKIRDKLCCKGGGSIKSIEIIEPKKPDEKKKEKEPGEPKEVEKKKEKEPEKEKPKDADKPKEEEKPKDIGPACCRQCYEGVPGGPCYHMFGQQPKPGPGPTTVPVPCTGYRPTMYPPPGSACCRQCYEGVPGGPCYHMFGRQPKSGPGPTTVPVPCTGYRPTMYPPPGSACCSQCYEGVPGGPCYHMFGGQAHFIQYDGYYGRVVHDSWSGGHNYNHSCYEDDPNACSVM